MINMNPTYQDIMTVHKSEQCCHRCTSAISSYQRSPPVRSSTGDHNYSEVFQLIVSVTAQICNQYKCAK